VAIGSGQTPKAPLDTELSVKPKETAARVYFDLLKEEAPAVTVATIQMETP
jgi:hypothetical protein